MGKVTRLADVRQDIEAESHFVGLISEDMEQGNGISEVPSSVFDRVNKLRAKAEENERREELIEG
ncbi:hypothetical protein [Idiomarina seosinensis]|uniref:Uncharacterized protein n=1 Tax=Idiomarina seosinensis TaxID=281739 RepID=A0A432ZHK1_9GAMM|nr:hypothetical protein [Idiomarina seosinensis]RUO77505.1 hypothetical protein CWI81_03240 [Idiomarina seosinensis]